MSYEKLQELVNVAHNKWVDNYLEAGVKQSLYEYTMNEEEPLNERIALAVAKLNYQVENGGFMQYFDNGYASGRDGGFFPSWRHTDGEQLFVTEWLLEQLDNMFFDVGNEVKYAIKTIRGFLDAFQLDDEAEVEETCSECNGDGTWYPDEEAEDEDAYEECSNCNGTGYEMVHNENHGCPTATCTYRWSELDRKYYKVNAAFMTAVEEKLCN